MAIRPFTVTGNVLSLTFENNVLTLSGERRFENDQAEKNYHRVERLYGSCMRSFTLPDTVSGDGIAAEYRDGALYLSLPKKEEVKARRVEIAGEGVNQKAMGAGAAPACGPCTCTGRVALLGV